MKSEGHPSGQAPLIAIGASAGGPAALATVIASLPSDLPAALVVVQHLDARFIPQMVDWLNDQSALPVEIAREGDIPTAGSVLFAGTAEHLVMKAGGRLGYTPEPAAVIYRPSIDVFFQSLLRRWQGPIIGVLLTGMGSDGALGLKALRAAGHHTIAQDATSSAVYGMPKAAANLKAAAQILPVTLIAGQLMAALASRKQGLRSRR